MQGSIPGSEEPGQLQSRVCVCVCAQKLQLCPTLYDSMDCSSPGSSVHGIFQVRRREGCHALLQGIFPTQGLNPRLLLLLHWQLDSLPLSHLGSLKQLYSNNIKKKKKKGMAQCGKSYNTHMEWVDYRAKTFKTHLWGLSTPPLFLTTGTFQNTCAHIIQWFFMIK